MTCLGRISSLAFQVSLLFAVLSTVHCTFRFGEQSEVLLTSDGRIRGARNRLNTDFVFGGLIPVHSDNPGSGGGECGPVRVERGLERMEAMLFAIDLINNDPNLLPGLEIGYDIRDTCNSENIGLDETIDLIITGSRLDIQSCQAVLEMASNTSIKPPTSGIIGAANSRVSVPIASLVRLFQTPQISYASSSAILSNRDRYEYFYRTIPPDDLQARAMIDILLRFNWTYVSTVFSRNPYGEPGIAEFRALAAEHGICIDLDQGIDDIFDETNFDTLASSLIESSANVVILFSSQDNAEKLLTRIANTTSATRFTWIASDAWARSINLVHQVNETAAGLYGIAPLTEHVDQFNDYFSQLTINSNIRNPWFSEYFSAFAGCNLTNLTNTCDRDQSVTDISRYEQGNIVPLVVDAVYAYAHALQNFLKDNCASPLQWNRANRSCVGQTRELDGEALLEYIGRVNFMNNVTGNHIIFDSNGNVEGRYEILNYQATGNGESRTYAFSRAGTWDSSIALTNNSELKALSLIDLQDLQFGLHSVTRTVLTKPQISQCGICEVGQVRRVVQSACCGICENCTGGMYSTDPTSASCLECGEEMWGNHPLMGSDSCVPIPESFISHSDHFSIAVIILAVIGLIAVITTTIIFIIYWKTPVVKSSGREQMITLLIGIGLIFVLAFVYVSPPEPGVCAVQRIGFWICYSVIFGALLVKIIRVTRIFFQASTLKRVRFTEPYYQVLFTSLIIAGQLVIVIIGLIVVNPDIMRTIRLNRDNQLDVPEIVVSCVVDHIAILVICAVYETLLIVLSTILGVMSVKYPENFNEARFVSFCTFVITIIWAAFVGLYAYFAVEQRQEIQNAITGLASVLTAFAVLACLFGPKLFIIIFRPDQNVANKASASNDIDTDVNLTTINFGNPSARASGIFNHTVSTVVDDTSMNGPAAAGKKSTYVPPGPTTSPTTKVAMTIDTSDHANKPEGAEPV